MKKKRIVTLALCLSILMTAAAGCSKAAVKEGASSSLAGSDYSAAPAVSERKHKISVDYIAQNPELPTGCESVSLAMAFNAMGVPTTKTELADKYMPIGDSYVTAFVGNPHDYTGTGIYPPGVVITAENYIDDKKLSLKPVDLSGVSFEELYRYIEKDSPVVFWLTGALNDPAFDNDSARTFNGIEYRWINNIHCVVLNGYDLDEGSVTVTDPLSGEIRYGADRMKYVYDKMGRLAMTLEKK